MSKPNEEKKQIYELWILKRNQDHIAVTTTTDYDAVHEKWKELTNTWINAIKSKEPFVLLSPIITAFDPGDISEITVRPVMQVSESKYHNPYQQQMVRDGFAKTIKQGNPVNSEILDEGYR